MKIKIETPEENSLIACVVLFFAALVFVTLYWIISYQGYIDINQDTFSLIDFVKTFFGKAFSGDIGSKIFAFVLLFSPLWCLIMIIVNIMQIKKRSEGGKPVLKTLYTDSGGMKFVYKAQGNIVEYVYPYSEITSLDMTINTYENSHGIACLQSTEVVIITKDGKNIQISLYATRDYIYKFLSLKKYIANFNYTIDGPIGRFEEFIKHYKYKCEKKPIPIIQWVFWGFLVFFFVMFPVIPAEDFRVIFVLVMALPLIIFTILYRRSL